MPQETVQPAPSPTFAYLVVADGPQAGAILQLRPGTVGLGRAGANALRLEDRAVSSEHASVHWEGAHDITVTDLGSENGTRVNGRPTQQHRLRHNDVVVLGETNLVFKLVGPAG